MFAHPKMAATQTSNGQIKSTPVKFWINFNKNVYHFSVYTNPECNITWYKVAGHKLTIKIACVFCVVYA